MSKSDTDIYAKVDGDPAQPRVLDDADPIDRDTPQSLIEAEQTPTVTRSTDDTGVDLDSADWALAHIPRPSGGTTCALLDAGHMEAGDEPGTVRVPESSQVIRRAGTRRLAGEDIEVLSLQRPSVNIQQYVSHDESSGQLLITSDPFDGHRGPDPSGPDTDVLHHQGDWFVCRDANNRTRGSGCYETYFPAEALQFRDHTHYDRPPVEVVEEECVTPEWDVSGSFGVIATEVVRVSDDAVPASDERMREIEYNAQQ